jgi:glycosyltransferase involved in cell wall biosynthesis
VTDIDVIVAVRNEEEAIPAFLDQVMALPLPSDVYLHVVFVEDSSTDGTLPLLRRLAREHPKLGYYSLVEGFGQGLAVSFALSRSEADAMIMMDVDGSHPIAVIPDMIAAFREGARVVQCVRRSLANRRRHRRLGAAAYQVAARWLTGSILKSRTSLPPGIRGREESPDAASPPALSAFSLPRQPERSGRFWSIRPNGRYQQIPPCGWRSSRWTESFSDPDGATADLHGAATAAVALALAAVSGAAASGSAWSAAARYRQSREAVS